MEYERRVQSATRELVRERAVESAHDLSDGGLAVALAEASFGPENVGADVTLDSDLAPELLLFHEGPSRVLISTDNLAYVEKIARKNSVQALAVGVTLESRFTIRNRTEILIDSQVDELKTIWETGLVNLLQDPVLV
jgi:phosphoribosylformylglycinamidine synthase